MLNSFTMYRPLTVFMTVAGLLFIGGMIPFGHYLYLVLTTKNAYGAHHIQSLIIGAVLINASFTTFALGIIANLTRINRSLIEDVLEVQKREIFK